MTKYTVRKEPFYVQLGSENYPIPVTDEKGTFHMLASDAGIIYFPSWRQPKLDAKLGTSISVQEQVYGDLIRKYPSTSMIPLLKAELERRDPNRSDPATRSYVSGLRGSPAVGKSFMFKLLGSLTHPRGAYLFDCKGVDMGSLFRELVFDVSAAVAETNAIDAKILKGNREGAKYGLKPENLGLLKAVCGDALLEETQGDRTVISIDWKAVELRDEKGRPAETLEEQERLSKKFQEILRQVCLSEGIAATENIAKIGLVERDGIAIRACDPNSADYGRPIMLEDPDQSKPGTLRKLDEWLPVLTGAEQECMATGAGGRTVDISRRNFPASFHVSITMNQAIEGMGSNTLDGPTLSRLALLIEDAPDATKNDWADRFCQEMTGLAARQLYNAEKAYRDKTEDFVEDLQAYRELGMTLEQKRNLKAHHQEQLQNIRKIGNIRVLAENMGSCAAQIALMLDPKSSYYRDDPNKSLSSEYEAYLTEQAKQFTLRAVSNMMRSAASVPAQHAPATTFRKLSERVKSSSHDGTINPSHRITLATRLGMRGDNLDKYWAQLLEQLFIPKYCATLHIRRDEPEKIHALAKQIAANHQIGVGRSNSNPPTTLADLYNLDAKELPGFRAEAAREKFIQHLRLLNPKLQLPQDPERLVSLEAMELALQHIEETALDVTKDSAAISVPNTDVNTLGSQPWRKIIVKDSIPADPDSEQAFHAPSKHLLPRDTLLTALTVPEVAKIILPGLWNTALRDTLSINGDAGNMATGKDAHFAVTSVTLRHADKMEVLYIIHDKKLDETIIVGSKINEQLQASLKEAKVHYFDAGAKNTAEKINEVMKKMLAGHSKPASVIGSMIVAFSYRSAQTENTRELFKLSMGEVLTRPEMRQCEIPTYVTNAGSREEISHMQKLLAEEEKKQSKRAKA